MDSQSASNYLDYTMTIRNLKKLKKDGENFEMTFYEEQPVPGAYQPPPADHQHAHDLDQFKDEIQHMMGQLMAGLIAQVREQVAQEAANNTRRLTQEINDLKERLRVVELRGGSKRPRNDED